MKKLLLLSLLALLLGACAAPATSTPDQQATIEAAVQATLMAAQVTTPAPETPAAPAESPGTTSGPTTTPQPPSTPQPQEAAQRVILPPLVKNFNPAPRPASTLGDPQAPVVMYEWSDYT